MILLSDPLIITYLVYMLIVMMLFLAINIVLVVFIYKDAKKRGMNAFMWLVAVLFFGLIAAVLYVVVRKPVKRRK